MATIEKPELTIAECEAAIAEHSKAIRQLNKKLVDLKKAAGVNELTEDEFRDRIIELSKEKTWKEFVTKSDVLDNVANLLAEGYSHDCLLLEDDERSVHSVVGRIGSRKWQEFVISVITLLYKENSFKRGGHWDDYGDTAGGCDEVAMDAAHKIIYGK
jgi:hypothetical protein